MSDKRALRSPMPPAARAIVDEAFKEVHVVIDKAFRAALALPGNPAEIENDALSVLQNVAAFAGAHFVTEVALAKKVDVNIARTVALEQLVGSIALFINRGII